VPRLFFSTEPREMEPAATRLNPGGFGDPRSPGGCESVYPKCNISLNCIDLEFHPSRDRPPSIPRPSY
jgi:hypothetical protein